ncbi:hypothetical protein X739_32310 [Mesorhizobium sp. LNHC220B00]|nr:hypothetical protein X739_32310 [Mesorhizobium sp. LNHC220B00]
MAAHSGPIPLRSSNVAAGVSATSIASGASRSASVELATDLPLQMFSAVAGPQLIKPTSPVTSQRLVAGDALSKQQALDPVDMAGPLTNQNLGFTADAPMVLLLDARYPNHRA